MDMSKKIVAVIMAVLLVISSGSVLALAGNERSLPGTDEIAGAVEKDFAGAKRGVSLLGTLSKSLVKNIGPYITDVVLTADNIDKAKKAASEIMAKLIDKITNPDDPSNPEEPSKPDEPSKPEEPSDPSKPGKNPISIEALKAFLERYIFVKVDDVDAAAMEAVKSADIDYELVTDSDGTVYIGIDIEKNPEIFNFSVFRKVVDGLYAAQGEELLKNNNGETDYAMSYEHIAGELALHAVVFAVTDGIMSATGAKNDLLLRLYDKAAFAELNYDEARLPSEIMAMLGVLLMDFMQFNLLRLFGLI